MRLEFKLSRPRQLVPFNYAGKLLGVLHKWLGKGNELHDGRSLYCWSNLQGLRRVGQQAGLSSSNSESVRWQLAFHEQQQALNVLVAAMNSRAFFAGMEVQEVSILPELSTVPETLRVLSPVLMRVKCESKHHEHLLPSDPRHSEYLTLSLYRKMHLAGLDSTGCSVSMDPQEFRTKLVRIHNIQNRCAVGPVTIIGTDEQRQFARNVGVGHCTGSGFGCLE